MTTLLDRDGRLGQTVGQGREASPAKCRESADREYVVTLKTSSGHGGYNDWRVLFIPFQAFLNPEVGRAVTCLRAAVASKLGQSHAPSGDDIGRWLKTGAEQHITHALGRQLIL